MALPTPPAYTTPIPNSPFYSVPTYFVQGATGPLVLGSGLFVNYATSTLSSSGGGGGGAVASIVGGTGIGVSSPTGNVTLTNTGVTSLIAGSGISLTANTGAITISSTGSGGTVTSITAGSGIAVSPATTSGGTITTSGTLQLANSGVTAGNYTTPNITVDAFGRITAAANGTAVTGVTGTLPISVTAGTTPVVSIAAATTTNSGAVQLSDSTSSLSSSTAATSLAVKTAFDVAVSAIPKSCITAAGTIVTGTAASIPVALPVGTNGFVLTADSTCVEGIKWASAGSGVSDIPCACITGKGALVTGTAPSTPVGLPAGTNGQVLFACSTAIPGLCWGDIPQAYPNIYGTVYGQTNFANTFLGQNAGIGLRFLTGGCAVTAIGFRAAEGLAAGSDTLTAVGVGALQASTCSSFVTAIGDRAMNNAGNTTENVAIGTLALRSVTGNNNTALGSLAGYDLVAGSNNIFIGRNAACANTSGNNNVVIGTGVTTSTPTVSCELVIGYAANCNWLTGNSTLAIKPGAGIIDCASTCGTANQVLVSTGANKIQWKSVNSSIAAPNYGSFISNSTQNVSTINVGQAINLTLVSANNFTLGGTTQVTATVAGTYNIQISLQIVSTSGGGDVEVWFVKNGGIINNSNTRYSIKNANEEEVAALNLVESLSAGQYIEVFWASDNSNMTLAALSSTMSGPSIPSAIVTIVPVGA